MSQKDVERLLKLYEAANRGDADAYFDGVSPEIEFHLSGAFPDLEPVYRGHAGIRRFFEQFTEPWEGLSVEPDRFVDRGSRILALVRFHARGRDGIEVQLPLAHLWTIEDGQAVRMDAYADQDEALRAVMAKDQTEIIERSAAVYAAFNRRDWDRFFADMYSASDYEWDPMEENVSYRGREAIIEYFGVWLEAWDEFHVETEDIEVAPAADRIFVALRYRGKGKGSAIPVEGLFFHVVELRDGKFVRAKEYIDRAEAVEAAGLRE